VTDLPPERRDIGMVFQSYALFPHLSVFGNVAYGLTCRGVPRKEERERVATTLGLVGLSGRGRERVTRLSGGEQQRVALARALVLSPRLLLLDEPLSNLDAALRVATRREIRRIQREAGVTTLYVTHDQEEAMAIADRIAVMDAGRIRQEGTPVEIYREPADAFVASFIGDANVVRGRVLGGEVVAGDGFRLPAEDLPAEGSSVTVSVRREDVRVSPGEGARVVERQYLGGSWHLTLESAGVSLRARHAAGDGTPPAPGEDAAVTIRPADVRVLPGDEG
jgi:ABC-type Fe3+/spermidine/putrescine transport system ATPase subunit